MTDYKQVPVTAAMAIADNFEKDQVVVVSFDRVHDKLHFTSYGRSALDKAEAARAADWIADKLGILPLAQAFEDYRVSPALNMIAAERARQRSEEHFDATHDDGHTEGELADLAACYSATCDEIYQCRIRIELPDGDFVLVCPWPECLKRDKHPRLKQLAIAGALIVAEIERLQRAEAVRDSKEVV